MNVKSLTAGVQLKGMCEEQNAIIAIVNRDEVISSQILSVEGTSMGNVSMPGRKKKAFD